MAKPDRDIGRQVVPAQLLGEFAADLGELIATWSGAVRLPLLRRFPTES